jgi:methionyl aminopeptidase
MDQTEEALQRAVAAAATGNRLGAIGYAVESYARPLGRGIVREYGGHGIGRAMHEDPHVPNVGSPERGVIMRTGLTLAIEPMLTNGSEETKTMRDGWTVKTKDGSLSTHFEHTVAVTPDGGRVLTRRLVPVLE